MVAIAGQLRDGDLVLLSGEVGAGKTTLVALLGAQVGVLEPVRSPTYTVAHSYALPDGRTLAHLDLYRQVSALDPAGWADLEPNVDGAALTCVEWPATLEPFVAGRPAWRVRLAIAGPHARIAWVDAPDRARAIALADAYARAC